MSKIKNGGLDQYGAEHFEQQHFGITGIEWVNRGQQLQTIIRAATELISVWELGAHVPNGVHPYLVT